MTGRHSVDRSHGQVPVAQVRGWLFHRVQASGRHRAVSASSVAHLAWPGEATAKLMQVRRPS